MEVPTYWGCFWCTLSLAKQVRQVSQGDALAFYFFELSPFVKEIYLLFEVIVKVPLVMLVQIFLAVKDDGEFL